ncbi:MAG: mechanosensitive ion channel family protein, partial [Nanoarchaeota archaeon]|nr:mechanosensitive ion channel family protein [Nanoarchaeota archaeon]
MLNQLIPNDYFRAAIVLVVSVIILQIFVSIFKKVFVKITSKTKTDLDDLILKKISKPLTLLAVIIGLRLGLGEVTFVENIQIIFDKIMYSLILITIFIAVYSVLFILINSAWRKYSKNKKKGRAEGLFHLIEGTLKVIFVLGGFISILSYWGVELGPLLAGIGIGGVAIAFALQSSLANIFGGISIILDETIHVGDLVNLDGGVNGKILKIGLRSTKVKTFDNEIIIIPNAKLADSNIHNVAQPEPKSRVVIPFGVAYGTDIAKVKKIVLAELKKVKNFVEKPEPSVRFLEMGDSSLNFKAFFFVNSFENRFAAIDEANTRIYNALNKARIEIPFPQLDINMKK